MRLRDLKATDCVAEHLQEAVMGTDPWGGDLLPYQPDVLSELDQTTQQAILEAMKHPSTGR